MDSPTSPWTTHRTRTVYDNPWICVNESDVTNPGGGKGIYGVVHFKNRAIGVIPVDEEGYTWLVGQYRYTLGSYEWEIPEGGCPDGESPLDAAKRELAEETGLVAEDYEVLLDDIALSNSVSDERATIFLARSLRMTQATPDETEDITIRRLPLDMAIRMVESGEITDAVSVMALLKLALRPAHQAADREDDPGGNEKPSRRNRTNRKQTEDADGSQNEQNERDDEEKLGRG